MSTPRPSRSRRRLAAVVVLALGLTLAGCGRTEVSSRAAGTKADALLLSGPNTNLVVEIPDGWHQVINSSDPMIPQMVAPITCMGADEVSCALGLARIATIKAKSIEEAVTSVEQSVTGAPGVTDATTVHKGAGQVGKRSGYRDRFTFHNPGATLTSEIAAVPSGPTGADADGNFEFSVVLVWVSDRKHAPYPEVIDNIVGSTLVHGGVLAP